MIFFLLNIDSTNDNCLQISQFKKKKVTDRGLFMDWCQLLNLTFLFPVFDFTF
jgi:hypothetical protein